MTFGDIGMAYLLIFVPVCGLLYFRAAIFRDRSMRRIVSKSTTAQRVRSAEHGHRRRYRETLVLLSLTLLVLCVMQPSCGTRLPETAGTGRDITFLVDVSRSMRAEDIRPNRLSAARTYAAFCLRDMDGDSVSLVAFAGAAVTRCPPTRDHDFFMRVLTDLSTDSVGYGGTDIGAAVRYVTEQAVLNGRAEGMEIFLFTDGDDHGAALIEAAREAGRQGIRLVVIGFGDEEGSPVPGGPASAESRYVEYEGSTVLSSLRADILKAAAETTPGGRFLRADARSPGRWNSAQKSVPRPPVPGGSDGHSGTPVYQLFLAGAVVLLCLEMITVYSPGARRYEKETVT